MPTIAQVLNEEIESQIEALVFAIENLEPFEVI